MNRTAAQPNTRGFPVWSGGVQSTVARTCRQELRFVDDYLARETVRHPEHVHCRRGCAECCYGTFAEERLLGSVAAAMGNRVDPGAELLLPAAILLWTGNEVSLHP